MRKKELKSILLVLLTTGLFFSGCATTKKILIETYTSPKEVKKVSGMINDSKQKDGKYLAMGINPKVEGKGNEKLNKILIRDIKEHLTQTNFIAIHPIYDIAGIGLNIEILDYNFTHTQHDIKAILNINFVINKGVTEYYSKSYAVKDTRYSKSGQGLPDEATIMSKLSKDVTKKFVKDISPLKTKQLRTFLPLPKEIKYVLSYAQKGNYKGAIKVMEKYEGDKELAYYYDLAVLYEALGSQNEDMKVLFMANKNYEKAMAHGGSSEEIVVKTKSRFDNFYEIFKKVFAQGISNKKLQKELQEEYGIEY